jgi:hypothetical protein
VCEGFKLVLTRSSKYLIRVRVFILAGFEDDDDEDMMIDSRELPTIFPTTHESTNILSPVP